MPAGSRKSRGFTSFLVATICLVTSTGRRSKRLKICFCKARWLCGCRDLTEQNLPLRRPAVLAYLLPVHHLAVRAVYAALRSNGLLPPGVEVPFTDYDESAAIELLKKRGETFSQVPAMKGATALIRC